MKTRDGENLNKELGEGADKSQWLWLVSIRGSRGVIVEVQCLKHGG